MLVDEREIYSWPEYERSIADIIASQPKGSEWLYRGHHDSTWKLETTLQRYLLLNVGLADYYHYAFRVKARLQTYLDRTWAIPSPPEYSQWLAAQDSIVFMEFPGYEYLAFLRHHGFPSPFLDWTQSQFIAAYFAMSEPGNIGEYASVIVYLETAGGGKERTSDKCSVQLLGPYVSAHERHFLQQSQYTICVDRRESGELCYVPYDDVLADKADAQQDLFWKLNIHASAQKDFLSRLDAMNINKFSLFGTTDSLVEAMALREVWLKESWAYVQPPERESPG